MQWGPFSVSVTEATNWHMTALAATVSAVRYKSHTSMCLEFYKVIIIGHVIL